MPLDRRDVVELSVRKLSEAFRGPSQINVVALPIRTLGSRHQGNETQRAEGLLGRIAL